MRSFKQLLAAFGLAIGSLISSVLVSTSAHAEPPTLDPAAIQKIKRMTDFLDGLQQFSVHTQSIIEEVNSSGHRIDYDLAASVTIKRPNKLSAVRSGEMINQRFFYDGKTLTLYNPSEKVYATKAAPETIEKMIDLARESVGILLPAADLLYRGAFPLMMQEVTLATVVGKTTVGGLKCDHLLFSRPGVDFQIWIAEGKRPWPCKYVVTDMDTARKLSITTFMSNWNIAPAVHDGQFTFVPPKGAQAIKFMTRGPTSGSDR